MSTIEKYAVKNPESLPAKFQIKNVLHADITNGNLEAVRNTETDHPLINEVFYIYAKEGEKASDDGLSTFAVTKKLHFNSLTIACGYSQYEIVEELLSKTADGKYKYAKLVASMSDNNRHLLTIAAKTNNTKILARLLKKQENGCYEFPFLIDGAVAGNNYSFMTAIRSGSLEFAKKLYEIPEIKDYFMFDSDGYRVMLGDAKHTERAEEIISWLEGQRGKEHKKHRCLY